MRGIRNSIIWRQRSSRVQDRISSTTSLLERGKSRTRVHRARAIRRPSLQGSGGQEGFLPPKAWALEPTTISPREWVLPWTFSGTVRLHYEAGLGFRTKEASSAAFLCPA